MKKSMGRGFGLLPARKQGLGLAALAVLLAVASVACSKTEQEQDGGGADAGVERLDAGSPKDASPSLDSGMPDASSPTDASPSPDAAVECTQDSQRCYTYPGCSLEDQGCPRLPTLYCAIQAIAERHRGCDASAQCTAVTLNGQCSGIGGCGGLIINNGNREAFMAETNVELVRYCASGSCHASPSCAPDAGPHSFACVAGHCQSAL